MFMGGGDNWLLTIKFMIMVNYFVNKYNWREESKTKVTDYVWLPDQVSSSLKTCEKKKNYFVNIKLKIE